MARAARLSLSALALLLLAVSSTQVLTRGYVYSNIGTLFKWSGSAQSWSGSAQALTCGDWTSYISNDGTACTPASQTVVDSYASAHAVVTVTHTPLLTNNTFTLGGFGSWSSANTGGCNGFTFTGQNAPDEDADSGLAQATSATCSSTVATVTLVQTFTIAGTPTTQTYSFWYLAPTVTYGDPVNCTQGTGTASLALKINAVVITVPALTLDGAWHQVSGTTTALANGSNTLTFTATLAAASGQTSHYNKANGIYICNATSTVAQPISIDNVTLSAVW